MTENQLIRRVDLLPQYESMRDEIDGAIRRVLSSGRYTLADEVKAFEKAFADYIGMPHVIGVADGTRAIVMILKVLGIGPGDEVVTTPFTAFPTIGAILEAGATPVFVDIDPESYLIDTGSVKSALSPRTRAVVPVHIFGNVVDIDALKRILLAAGREDVAVIEDAAQAHGSTIDGRKAGALTDFSSFSFYPTKNLGGYGDGGAIACRDPEIAERLTRLRNHGFLNKDLVPEAGINSRLNELQAAILSTKLAHLDAMNARRRALVEIYADALPACGFTLQSIPENVVTNWHVFEPRFSGDRDALAAHCEKLGVQTNIYYTPPHHLQPGVCHLGLRARDFPGVQTVCKQAIALPLYSELPESDVHRVVDAIKSYGN